jgi:AcrR family transcriptional regulator
MKPNDRKQQILATALALAVKQGYMHVTRENLSDRCGVAPSLISHYFTTMALLRRAVMGEAIRVENLAVLLQGIAACDPRACKISDELRMRVMQHALGEN